MDDDAAGDDGGDDGDDEGKRQAIWNPESDFVFLIEVSEDPVHDVGSDLDQEVALDPGDGLEAYAKPSNLKTLLI